MTKSSSWYQSEYNLSPSWTTGLASHCLNCPTLCCSVAVNYQVTRGLGFQPVLTVDTDLSCVWYSQLLNGDVPFFLVWRPQRTQVQAMFHGVHQHCSILATSLQLHCNSIPILTTSLQHHCNSNWCNHIASILSAASPVAVTHQSHVYLLIDSPVYSLPPLVSWHCWLGDRKAIQPVKNAV